VLYWISKSEVILLRIVDRRELEGELRKPLKKINPSSANALTCRGEHNFWLTFC
jgi:hypothetical protein